MPLPVIFLDEADEEVTAAMRWYEDRRRGLGLEFLGSLDNAVARIAEAPAHFAAWLLDERYRHAVLDRFPYVVIFEVRDKSIEVVAVAHGARLPGFWRDRVKR